MERTQIHSGVEQTFGPVLVPGTAVPKPWFPIYPSLIEPKRALTAAILAGSFFWGAFTPTPPSADQAPAGPSTIQGTRLQIQYQAVTGPVFVPTAGYNPAGLEWTPVYPARPARLEVHASQQPAYFKSPLPLPAAPALSWGPEYPDRIEPPRGLTAPYQRAHVLDPFPRTRVDDYAWRGVYPDQVFRRELTAAHVPAVFKNPTPLPAAPALSWSPVYPDKTRGRPPEVGSYYVRPLNEPPDIARLGWRGSYPDSVEHRRAQPTGWYVRPLNEPPDIARLGWRGQAPAQIEVRRTQPSGWVVLSPFPVTAAGVDAFAWRGQWPDVLSRLERPAWLAPAYFKSPLPMPAAPALSWHPVYPDKIDPARALGVALQRAHVFYPEPQGAEEPFGWRGEWPDVLFRLETHASRAPAYFKSPLPMAAAPPLSWLGRYADKVDPARNLLAAQQRAVFFDAFPIAVPTSQFGWRGQWPDVLFRLERRPWLESPAYFKSPLPQPAAPILSWRPNYPVQFFPARGVLTAPYQRAVFAHPFPITAVDAFAWWGEYPDLLTRLERRPWLAPASFFAPYPLAAAPPLSWGPEYPDRIDPARALGAALQRAFFFDPRPFPAVQVGWFGAWPDVLSRLERRPWLDVGYFKSPLPQEAAPPLSWLGQWPADFARAFTHASLIPSYFEPSGFQPAQAVPPLAWLPIFPDFARGDTQIRWELFVLNYEPIVVPLPPLPCGVEAHNVTVAFPYADGVMFLTPTATGVIVTIVSSTDPTVTPDE